MYHKRDIGELKNLEFIGNFGSIAEFEDIIGMGFNEVIKDGEIPRFKYVISFIYACHIVAMARQKKEVAITLDEFKLNADHTLLDLFKILLQDSLNQKDNSDNIEKKIPKTIKK